MGQRAHRDEHVARARGRATCTTSPDETAKPARGRARRAAPRRRRRGRRTSRRGGAGRPGRRAPASSGTVRATRRGCGRPARAAGRPRPRRRRDGVQRRRGGHDGRARRGTRATRPPSRSSPGHGARHGSPPRTASTPTPGGPPHLWALAVSTDQPPGSGAARPTDWAASTSSGTPAPGAAAATPRRPAARVPTSWLALCRQARATPRRRDGRGPGARSTRPERVHRDERVRPPARLVAARPRAARRSARPREATSEVPARRAAARAARARPRWTAWVPDEVKRDLVGPAAEVPPRRLAGLVGAGPAPGAPWSVPAAPGRPSPRSRAGRRGPRRRGRRWRRSPDAASRVRRTARAEDTSARLRRLSVSLRRPRREPRRSAARYPPAHGRTRVRLRYGWPRDAACRAVPGKRYP